MKSFDDFFTELISNYQWYTLLRMYREETIKKAAHKVYAILIADETVDIRPMSENRKHVYNICIKDNPVGDKPKGKEWFQVEQEKKEEKQEWKPVSWEKRAEYLKQVQAEIDKVEDRKIRPLLAGEAELKGQYDPPKPSATCAPAAPVEVILEHIDKVNTARRKFYLERNPGASEEEINAYLKKFEMI